jgi:hypothetical protein
MAVPLEQPLPTVPLDELPDCVPRLVERRELVAGRAFLPQRSDPVGAGAPNGVVSVWERNPRAITFYTEVGFEM